MIGAVEHGPEFEVDEEMTRPVHCRLEQKKKHEHDMIMVSFFSVEIMLLKLLLHNLVGGVNN